MNLRILIYKVMNYSMTFFLTIDIVFTTKNYFEIHLTLSSSISDISIN